MPAQPTAYDAYRALRRAFLAVKRSLGEELARHGLTGAQFAVLTRIPDEGIPLTQLAEASWSDPGNLTGIVDRLERDGLVQRQRSAEDRRVVLAKLTEQGRRVLDAVTPVHRAHIAQLFDGFAQQELVDLIALLDRLAERAAR